MGQREMAQYFNVKCITHRRDPIWQAFISQLPPSESSVIRGIAAAHVINKRLKYDLTMPHVLDVAVHFFCGAERYTVIKMAKTESAEVCRALEAMARDFPDFSKFVIAVDEDIDPRNANLVNWALTYRVQPHRDFRIVTTRTPHTWGDYSINPPPSSGLQRASWMEQEEVPDEVPESSRVLIDATLKWPYPPVSLPKKEYMDKALSLWQELGLPKLDKLAPPWYGYNLGYWSEENEQQAELAGRGGYYQTGEVLIHRRQKWGGSG